MCNATYQIIGVAIAMWVPLGLSTLHLQMWQGWGGSVRSRDGGSVSLAAGLFRGNTGCKKNKQRKTQNPKTKQVWRGLLLSSAREFLACSYCWYFFCRCTFVFFGSSILACFSRHLPVIHHQQQQQKQQQQQQQHKSYCLYNIYGNLGSTWWAFKKKN